MGKTWQSAMEEYGISDASDPHMTLLPENTPADSPIHVDLSDLTVIEATGADAADFLQGQFCNDLGAVSVNQAQLSGYCTPKGRLLALLVVVGVESGYRLIVQSSVSEAFLKRLSMFVMRSNVTLEVKDECLCTGIISDSAGDWGEESENALKLQAPLSASIESGAQIISWPTVELDGKSRQRRLVIDTEARQISQWGEHSTMPKAARSLWRYGDIQQGVPSIFAATSDAFVPQMVNLQLINALSFTKGCYPGQEIVARMQYLGKIKRHMRRFVMSYVAADTNTKVPAPGDALANGDDANAGIVVDGVANGTQVELLAVIKVSANADAFNYQGATLRVAALPYDLPSLDDSDSDKKGEA